MLRHSRPLLAEVQSGVAAAAAGVAAAAAASSSSAGRGDRPFVRRRRDTVRKPLSDRYDLGGLPHPALNTKYSALVVGEHFGRIVFDRRTELMAVLNATNLIRETIAGEGRILLVSSDKRLEAEMLAAARDSGEFAHVGKWPPGGFTNRPQVSVVPQLPSLVIALEHDNHVLMREAFQMCIPRVAPVDVFNNKADFTPEVPLHAAEYTLHEKKRMLAFFTSFIAKLKFGQMPVGDTQGRFKEFANRFIATYQKDDRDLPEPYVRAASRPFDSRPDLHYGVKPAYVAFNAHRSFEESQSYHVATLQPRNYMDPAATEDDIIARDLPSIDSYDVGDTVEYTKLSERYAAAPDSDAGTYVRDMEGNLVPGENNRDFEHEELLADDRARYESGVRMTRQWNEDAENSVATARADKLALNVASTPDAELRDQYEEWYKDRQDEANDFIPYAEETDHNLSSTFSQPSEKQAQDRLWKLKQRVRESQAARNAAAKSQAASERMARGHVTKPISRHAVSTPFVDPSILMRKYSTHTMASRRGFATRANTKSTSTDSTAAAAATTPAASSRFVFPRFLLPAFLFVPVAAYAASLLHSEDEDKEKVISEQQDVWENLKYKFGLVAQDAQSLSPVARSALQVQLSAAEAQLSLSAQAYQAILDRVPQAQQAGHSLIIEDLLEKQEELKKEIAEIKNKLK